MVDAPPPDDKDWTWVLGEPCPECGYDAATIVRRDVPTLTLDAAVRLAAAVRAEDATLRPGPQTWSTSSTAPMSVTSAGSSRAGSTGC